MHFFWAQKKGESFSLVIEIVGDTIAFIIKPVIMEGMDILCCGPKIWTRVVGWVQIVSFT